MELVNNQFLRKVFMLSVSLIVMSSPMFCSIISLSLCHSLAFPINSFNAFLFYSFATTWLLLFWPILLGIHT